MILCVYGAGGNGKTLIDLAQIINEREHKWENIVFVDDVTEKKVIYDTDVYKFSDIEKHFPHDEIEFSISLGETSDRKTLYEKVKNANYNMPVIIHPNAFIPQNVNIGEGTIIADASIGSDTVIGANTVISQSALIGHDTVIGSHCTISAGSFIAGHVKLGNEVYVGPMAAVRDRICIEDTAVVAMAAAVYRDVPSHAIAIGNPARNMKKEEQYKIFK